MVADANINDGAMDRSHIAHINASPWILGIATNPERQNRLHQ